MCIENVDGGMGGWVRWMCMGVHGLLYGNTMCLLIDGSMKKRGVVLGNACGRLGICSAEFSGERRKKCSQPLCNPAVREQRREKVTTSSDLFSRLLPRHTQHSGKKSRHDTLAATGDHSTHVPQRDGPTIVPKRAQQSYSESEQPYAHSPPHPS